MTFLKSAAFGAIVLMATAACSAQQKFPLRQGEWVSTISTVGSTTQPMVLRMCLTDELWLKALTHNPACSIQQLTSSPRGASYSMDCPMKSFQMKGKVDLNYDGMEHMTAKASMSTTFNGTTTNLQSVVDYRFKGSACSPDDVNMKPGQPQ